MGTLLKKKMVCNPRKLSFAHKLRVSYYLYFLLFFQYGLALIAKDVFLQNPSV